MAQKWRKGATPCPRSGVGGEGGGREKIPCVRGQGQRPGGDTPRPKPEARGGGREELPQAPRPKAKGGGWEEKPHAQGQGWGRKDQPHVQGTVARRVQECLEELSHIEGQEGRW